MLYAINGVNRLQVALERMLFVSLMCFLTVNALGAESDDAVTTVFDEAALEVERTDNPVVESHQAVIDALSKMDVMKGIRLDPKLSPVEQEQMGLDVDVLLKQYAELPSFDAMNKKKSVPPVVVFVSASVPVSSMRRLILSAEATGVPLVFRGLMNNSLEDFVTYIIGLLTEDGLSQADVQKRFKALTFQVDPELFKRFDVHEAPAYMAVRDKPARCIVSQKTACDRFEDVEHTIVFGDVSMRYALEQIDRLAPEFHEVVLPVLNDLTPE